MSGRTKILIIEDEPDISAYFETLLQDNGYDTVIASNGEEGYDLAKRQKPDLITLDITMPGQSGIGVYCRFREDSELKKIPVVIITATNDSVAGLRERLKDYPNPEGFFSKPIKPDELIKKISELLSV